MRLVEFASAEEQLALWKLVSDSVWTAISVQAKQQARSKSMQRGKAKSKRTVRPPTVPVQAPVPQPQQPQKQAIQPPAVSGFGSADAQNAQKPIGPQSPTGQ